MPTGNEFTRVIFGSPETNSGNYAKHGDSASPECNVREDLVSPPEEAGSFEPAYPETRETLKKEQ